MLNDTLQAIYLRTYWIFGGDIKNCYRHFNNLSLSEGRFHV